MNRILYVALAVALAGSAQAQPATGGGAGPRACFYSHDFQGWRAADDRTVYIRAGVSDVYQLGMASACPNLSLPAARLITRTRGGSGLICSPLDWELSVSQPGPGAIPTPCIVGSMRKLSPAEAAALPPKLRP